MNRIIVSVADLFVVAPLFAKQPTRASVPTLHEGDEVSLKFAEALSSKTAVADDPVQFVLADDLKAGDVTVAKAGAKALGTVSHVQRAGMFGKGAELAVRLDYLRVGGTKVKLRGTKAREGQSKQGSAIALTILLGPIGIFKHGKEIEILGGTVLKAFVADDVTLEGQ
jgi:hypothetical protein